ncbi:OmpA family protein [Hymenobacter sp. 15J16-1T3B]|uniref:OmpA family protein n=1 Tax=Hymenobacter sp. 15J16-1T3B TaxID=2886941 RepID=UPI001D128A3A|nr:OmpA family protein [Hymenobacter sp. 15J16-1T3B]MCC3156606.1 OmpA family protein [Hymenobacter sp. 15J16-1T3B]
MKSPLLLLSLALLGFSACQSDNKPAAGVELASRRLPEGLTYTLPTDQLFAPNDAKLTDQAGNSLEALAGQLQKQQAKQLIIRCYTDEQGDEGKNLALTQERVQSVGAWLREHGVAAPVELQGMGQANPGAAGQGRNRRLEVVVMQ